MRQLDQAIARCRVEQSLDRTVIDGFSFPLGAYPVEPIKPVAGYTLAFEAADGDDGADLTDGGDGDASFEDSAYGGDSDEESEQGGPGQANGGGGGSVERPGSPGGRGGRRGDREDEDQADAFADSPEGGLSSGGGSDLEEWPDRYVFDILVPANRVEPLCRALFALLPGRIFPILDVLGHDEYREVDPYVSYELLGTDRFTDAIRRYRAFFFEDGLVGFGAMSEDPFIYIFVDEHKIITVRVEVPMRERVEQVLAAFDLKPIEELHGADSVTHEHRGVLDAPPDRPDLLMAEEIVEDLQEQWRLELNINPDTNLDEDGRALGITGWRCFVRVDPPPPWSEEDAAGEMPQSGDANRQGVKGEGTESAEQIRARSGAAPASAEGPIAAGATDSRPSVAEQEASRYAEVLLTADSLISAQDLAVQSVIELLERDPPKAGSDLQPDEHGFVVVVSDRLRPESFGEAVRRATGKPFKNGSMRVWSVQWAT